MFRRLALAATVCEVVVLAVRAALIQPLAPASRAALAERRALAPMDHYPATVAPQVRICSARTEVTARTRPLSARSARRAVAAPGTATLEEAAEKAETVASRVARALAAALRKPMALGLQPAARAVTARAANASWKCTPERSMHDDQ
jgi:hypothetical protein